VAIFFLVIVTQANKSILGLLLCHHITPLTGRRAIGGAYPYVDMALRELVESGRLAMRLHIGSQVLCFLYCGILSLN
jgi:hypothetical protein